jgi:hypothetical protein
MLLQSFSSSNKVFFCDNIFTIKVSCPRPVPQGGAHDSDMHGGQQYWDN